MTDAAQNLPVGTSEPQAAAPVTDAAPAEAPAVQQTWPDDWRIHLAGNDEKELKRLETLSSPQDVWKKYRNMESEYSKRQPRLEYSADMPAEKLAEWRKQEGIPDAPDKYDLQFEDGIVIGEADKPFIDEFTKYAHENNLPNKAVKDSVRWYMERQAVEQEQLEQRNYDFEVQNNAELMKEWGAEYKGNINAINELFVDNPEIKDLLFGSRDSEGLRIGNNAKLVRWAVDIAKRLNPTATLVFPEGQGGIKGAENRLAELKGMMGTENWYRNPALGKEYEDLLTRLDKAKPRR